MTCLFSLCRFCCELADNLKLQSSKNLVNMVGSLSDLICVKIVSTIKLIYCIRLLFMLFKLRFLLVI